MQKKTNTEQVERLVRMLEARMAEMEENERFYAAKQAEFAEKEKDIFGKRAVLLNEIAQFKKPEQE